MKNYHMNICGFQMYSMKAAVPVPVSLSLNFGHCLLKYHLFLFGLHASLGCKNNLKIQASMKKNSDCITDYKSLGYLQIN